MTLLYASSLKKKPFFLLLLPFLISNLLLSPAHAFTPSPAVLQVDGSSEEDFLTAEAGDFEKKKAERPSGKKGGGVASEGTEDVAEGHSGRSNPGAAANSGNGSEENRSETGENASENNRSEKENPPQIKTSQEEKKPDLNPPNPGGEHPPIPDGIPPSPPQDVENGEENGEDQKNEDGKGKNSEKNENTAKILHTEKNGEQKDKGGAPSHESKEVRPNAGAESTEEKGKSSLEKPQKAEKTPKKLEPIQEETEPDSEETVTPKGPNPEHNRSETAEEGTEKDIGGNTEKKPAKTSGENTQKKTEEQIEDKSDDTAQPNPGETEGKIAGKSKEKEETTEKATEKAVENKEEIEEYKENSEGNEEKPGGNKVTSEESKETSVGNEPKTGKKKEKPVGKEGKPKGQSAENISMNGGKEMRAQSSLGEEKNSETEGVKKGGEEEKQGESEDKGSKDAQEIEADEEGGVKEHRKRKKGHKSKHGEVKSKETTQKSKRKRRWERGSGGQRNSEEVPLVQREIKKAANLRLANETSSRLKELIAEVAEVQKVRQKLQITESMHVQQARDAHDLVTELVTMVHRDFKREKQRVADIEETLKKSHDDYLKEIEFHANKPAELPISKVEDSDSGSNDCSLQCNSKFCAVDVGKNDKLKAKKEEQKSDAPLHCYARHYEHEDKIACSTFKDASVFSCPEDFVPCAMAMPIRGRNHSLYKSKENFGDENFSDELPQAVLVSGENMHKCMRLLLLPANLECNERTVTHVLTNKQTPEQNTYIIGEPQVTESGALFANIKVKAEGTYNMCLVQYGSMADPSNTDTIMGQNAVGELKVSEMPDKVEKLYTQVHKETVKSKNNIAIILGVVGSIFAVLLLIAVYIKFRKPKYPKPVSKEKKHLLSQ